VVGTLVWDQIHVQDPALPPFEDWGGIAYALSALDNRMPEGWVALPILKVGADVEAEARAFIGGLPRIDDAALRIVPEINNRVELDYTSESRRVEQLTGGVPSWEAHEITGAVGACDALYVNFISGYEMGLEAATAVRATFPGPIYTDLHSLFLASDAEGRRYPSRLPSPDEWLRSADVIQVNEDEFALLSDGDDPWRIMERRTAGSFGMIAVTLGERGAAYATGPGFDPDPAQWPDRAERTRTGRGARGNVTLRVPPISGDPTGCGDVWGATMFASLLGGLGIEEAMAEANRIASANVGQRGASGLARYLAEAGSVGRRLA